MIDLQIVTEFMLQHFEQVTISQSGQHFLARCLLCGDSKKSQYKKRFNLNWNNGIPGYHCWNCGESGNFYKIYSIVKGITYEQAIAELNKYKKEEITKKLKKYRKSKISSKSEEFNFNQILNDCYSINSNPDSILGNRYVDELKKFYKNRKIPLDCDIFVAYKGDYKTRFIIPLYDENKNIIYFQARRVPGTKKEPKYKNPVKPKELIIPNKHKFDIERPIVITEGILDSYVLGTQGTSCLGKEVSEYFLSKIFKICKKRPILALDNDLEGYKSLFKFLRKNKFSKRINYFIHPINFRKYKDLNSIACGENLQNVYEVVISNSVDYTKAILKLKNFSKLLEDKYEINESRFRLYCGG